jgi:hypothetical protein
LEKEKPALGDVVADGFTAVIAGADTTASALSSLFFFLLSHPKYYEKLQEEVDSHFALGVDPLETSSHADMKFLNACMLVYLLSTFSSNDMFLATKHCVSILQSPQTDHDKFSRQSYRRLVSSNYVLMVSSLTITTI